MNPFMLIILSMYVGASLWEAFHRNINMAVYWFSAFVLNLCVVLR